VAVPRFDTFIAIDWSGATKQYSGIAVAACDSGRSTPKLIRPLAAPRWTRSTVADWLCGKLAGRRRLLIGLDFAFGFPFADGGYLGGNAPLVRSVFDLWKLIDSESPDPDFGCDSFISNPAYSSLFWKAGPTPLHWIEHKRRTEYACAERTRTRPETVYKLLGSKQVGKASLTGMRVLHHIRSVKVGDVAFWPFEKVRTSAMVEIYPTLFRKRSTGSSAKLRSSRDLNQALTVFGCNAISHSRNLSDHETDALISAAGLRTIAQSPTTWSHRDLSSSRVQREGWIFGV
jgi:hypothetical protein